MGFFDDVKKAAADAKQGWSDMVADQNAAADAARLAQAQASIIEPTPQEEIDRLNAGTGPGRGVVTGNANSLEPGENVGSAGVTLRVRMRLDGGALGPEKALKMRTSSAVIRALVPGTEIPVDFDRSTGEPTAIDAKAVAAELAARGKSGGRGF